MRMVSEFIPNMGGDQYCASGQGRGDVTPLSPRLRSTQLHTPARANVKHPRVWVSSVEHLQQLRVPVRGHIGADAEARAAAREQVERIRHRHRLYAEGDAREARVDDDFRGVNVREELVLLRVLEPRGDPMPPGE